MIKKIKFLSTAIYYRIISKTKLAKRLEVNFGKNCNFMTRSWGSEPYLITMGDNVRTSSGVKFITHDGAAYVIRNKYPEYNQIDLFGEIIIGNNVFIGMDTTILPNTKIGNNIIIGACSLVKGELKDNSVYAGIPAKYICSLDEFHNKNKDKYDYIKHYSPKEKKSYLLKKYKKND